MEFRKCAGGLAPRVFSRELRVRPPAPACRQTWRGNDNTLPSSSFDRTSPKWYKLLVARDEELRNALVDSEQRAKEGWAGRWVGVRFVYEDEGVFFDFFPEYYAEVLVALAGAGWTPFSLELERFALSGGEITKEMVEMKGKRVVRVMIEYSKAKSQMPEWTPEQWQAFHKLHPDIRIDPKFDRERPLL